MKRHTLLQTVAELPEQPGVYQFLERSGKVLYVGKATNLKQRVKSYFADDTGRGPVIEEMIKLAANLRVVTTDSELEAVILESNLIKRLKPKYNSIGKDDRSSYYIVIEPGEWARVHLMRGQDLAPLPPVVGRKQYGPYVGVSNMRSVLKAIRRIWPHRDCADTKFDRYQKLGRGCLFGQIGLCPAPCVAADRASYDISIKQLNAFLSGKRRGLIDELRLEMEKKAEDEQFEAAAVARDRLFALEHMQQLTNRGLLEGMPDRTEWLANGLTVECYDISNIQGEYAVGVLVRAILPRLATGKILTKPNEIVLVRERYRKFQIKWVEGANDPLMLAEVLTRRFRRALREPLTWSLPDILMVDGGTTQLAAARQAAKSLGITTPIVAVAKGPTRKRVDLYCRPADERRLPIPKNALREVALRMREEAHRYAISYYRSRHRRALIPPKHPTA